MTATNNVNTVTITPTGAGVLKVNGTIVNTGNSSGAIALTAGVNTITVTTQETGKAIKTYTLTITKAGPAPTFTSAAVNAAGTQLAVTFNKNMMATPPASPAGFTVTSNGIDITSTVTGVTNAGSDTTIELALGAAVTTGDTIQVAYTLGTVLAADGGVLATFSNQAVTNNSTVAKSLGLSLTNGSDLITAAPNWAVNMGTSVPVNIIAVNAEPGTNNVGNAKVWVELIDTDLGVATELNVTMATTKQITMAVDRDPTAAKAFTIHVKVGTTEQTIYLTTINGQTAQFNNAIL